MRKANAKRMTKRLKSDSQNTLPHSNASQLAEYPGTSGRMLSEWLSGCSGIRNGADRAFDGIAVDLDAAVGQVAATAVVVSGDVGQGLAQGLLGGCSGAVVVQSGVKAGEDGSGALLPYGPAGGRVAAADVGLTGC